jgi:hypothetical protein
MSVVAINKLTNENHEFNAFSNALDFQNWTFKVQSIIQSTGLPLTSDFTLKETILPSGSMANRFGHKTLGDYILSNKNNMGHGYQWNDWCDEYNALNCKTKFGIYESNKNEILSQVNDIQNALGRIPNDSSEFHKVKDDILLKQKRESEVRHQTEIRGLNHTISELTLDLEISKNNFTKIEDELGKAIPESVIQSYVDQLKSKESDIIQLKEKISLLESNASLSLDLDINKLINNYHSVLGYLNKFREKNNLLKNEIKFLKKEVVYLKSELKIKNILVKKLFSKNNQLTNISLITTSLLVGSLSVMLFYMMIMSI